MAAPSPPVLVIADLFFVAKLRSMFSELGYESLSVREEQEALRLCQESRPAHLILDLNVSGFDWERLVSELKSDPALATIPILAFTNHADKDRIARARELGCERVVTKGQIANRLGKLIASDS